MIKLDRKSWKPCLYCSQQNTGSMSNGNNRPVTIAKANYCQYCGRPLSESSWNKLERKVNTCNINLGITNNSISNNTTSRSFY